MWSRRREAGICRRPTTASSDVAWRTECSTARSTRHQPLRFPVRPRRIRARLRIELSEAGVLCPVPRARLSDPAEDRTAQAAVVRSTAVRGGSDVRTQLPAGTYAELLAKLDHRAFAHVPEELRRNILAFYGSRPAPKTRREGKHWESIQRRLAAQIACPRP